MIVKVLNDRERESWSYFECEIIHTKYKTIGSIESKGSCVVLLKNPDVKGDTQVKLLNLETQKSHLRTILTDRVCYILNSEGKTIDKI